MITSFAQYRMIRENREVERGLHIICEALVLSGTPFRTFWEHAGLPALLQASYTNERELLKQWMEGVFEINGLILTESGTILEADGTGGPFDFGPPALNNPAYKAQKKDNRWFGGVRDAISNWWNGGKQGAAPGAPPVPDATGPGGDTGAMQGKPNDSGPSLEKGAPDPTGKLNPKTQQMVDKAIGDIKNTLASSLVQVKQKLQGEGNSIGWQVANHIDQQLDKILAGFKFKSSGKKFDKNAAWGATQDQAGGEDYKKALERMAGGGGAPTVQSMMPQPKAGPGGMQQLMSDPSTQAQMVPVLAQQLGVDPQMVQNLVAAGIHDPNMIKQMIDQHKAKGGTATAGAQQPSGAPVGAPTMAKEHRRNRQKGDALLMESLARGAGKRPSPANPMG